MASLDMEGPFDLEREAIDAQVTKSSAGNYALGYVNSKGVFIVKYVGRSDTDLNLRLKQHSEGYPRFKYSYADSSRAAFEKECRNYHDFGGSAALDNSIHPDRATGADWQCPLCRNF